MDRPLGANQDKMTPLIMAASKGNLEMVKYLLDYCKTSKHDRYRRTALTHACMNGASAVAAHLLKIGMDPNGKADSSGNTDLHYACAYGWYHCMLVLVEAGADINAYNEWKLTPVGAAIKRGHAGIAKYLLELPGVDINAKDDDGRTVLLSLVADAADSQQRMPLTASLFEEVRDLVERRGASASSKDNSGRNALHYLASYSYSPPMAIPPKEETSLQYAKKLKAAQKLHLKFVGFFIKKGCPTLGKDEKGKLPIMEALENKIEDLTGRKNIQLVRDILSGMESSVAKGGNLLMEKDDISETNSNILHTFACSCSLEYIEDDLEILKTLASMLQVMESKATALHSTLPHLVEHKTDVLGTLMTPVMNLCHKLAKSKGIDYASVANSRHVEVFFEGLSWNKETGALEGLDEKWAKFVRLLESFIEVFEPKLSYTVKKQAYHPWKDAADAHSAQEVTVSALNLVSHVPGAPEEKGGAAFDMMFEKVRGAKAVLDSTDEMGKTELNRAVLSGRIEQVERLAGAGADVDHPYYSPQARLKVREGEEIYLKSCPIADAVEMGNLRMVR